jgi:hypothetical protein
MTLPRSQYIQEGQEGFFDKLWTPTFRKRMNLAGNCGCPRFLNYKKPRSYWH